MRTWALAWLAAAGCGRIGFEELAAAADAPSAGEGLVAWYRMDALAESTERPVPDATGRGHDGRCDLARLVPPLCPVAHEGRVGGAYHFESNALIVVDSAPDLVTTAGFTVTAWLWLDPGQPVSRACAVTKGLSGGSANSWALCVEPSRQLLFFTVAGGASDSLRSQALVSAETWHHAAIRWDGATKQAFLDGVEVARSTAAIDFDGQTVRIGGDLDSGNQVARFPGDLDEIRIYDRAITDAELAALAGGQVTP